MATAFGVRVKTTRGALPRVLYGTTSSSVSHDSYALAECVRVPVPDVATHVSRASPPPPMSTFFSFIHHAPVVFDKGSLYLWVACNGGSLKDLRDSITGRPMDMYIHMVSE
jgi:hypothetical protein